jgi:hypothetical protein
MMMMMLVTSCHRIERMQEESLLQLAYCVADSCRVAEVEMSVIAHQTRRDMIEGER